MRVSRRTYHRTLHLNSYEYVSETDQRFTITVTQYLQMMCVFCDDRSLAVRADSSKHPHSQCRLLEMALAPNLLRSGAAAEVPTPGSAFIDGESPIVSPSTVLV